MKEERNGNSVRNPAFRNVQKNKQNEKTKPMKTFKKLTFATSAAASFQAAVIVVAAAALLALSTPSTFANPTITVQPADASVSIGANVTNSVNANGASALDYQWWSDSMELSGETNRLLRLNNIQPPDAGGYYVVVSDSDGSVTSRVAQVTVDTNFTKITTGNIVTDPSQSWGCAWGDYDNDGYIDLAVGVTGLSLFYRNNGDGSFAKITNTFPGTYDAIPPVRGDYTPAWADYDNDGFLDLFLSDGDPFGSPVQRLYRNNGNGTFARITTGPLVADTGHARTAAWGDYDNDGYLDVVLSEYETTKSLYHNNGDGTFTKMTSNQVGSLVTDIGGSLCAAWADYDDDGDLDVLFTQEDGPGRLYRNNGDGTFTLVTSTVLGNSTAVSVGIAWEDFFNRGHLDLFIVNGAAPYRENDFYFRNNGDGTFTSMTTNEVGDVVADASPGYGCAAADYDNDGYLDLFVANCGQGYPGAPGKPETNRLYHNNGDGTFSRVYLGSLTSDSANSTTGAWGDYDNDGFMDLFVCNGTWVSAGQAAFLYRNNGNTNHWLTLKLVGTVSNRSAIGTKVRVKATLGGESIWQLRHVSSASSLAGGNDLRPHFGLRDATVAETVRIEWPSGIVQELHNVAADQFLTVTEPAKLEPQVIESNGVVELKVKSWKGFVYDIEASSNLTSWAPLTTLTNDTGTFSLDDPEASGAKQRFYRTVAK
jgi:ASPIC and UnbV/FG-GAP-like repeat